MNSSFRVRDYTSNENGSRRDSLPTIDFWTVITSGWPVRTESGRAKPGRERRGLIASTKKFGFNSRQLALWYSEAGNAILNAQSLSKYPAKVFRRNNPRLWAGRVCYGRRGVLADSIVVIMLPVSFAGTRGR